jgi:Zinc knuckle
LEEQEEEEEEEEDHWKQAGGGGEKPGGRGRGRGADYGCHECKSTEHMVADCPERRKRWDIEKVNKKKGCVIRKEMGHFLGACLNKTPGLTYCYKCGKDGHYSSECKDEAV